MPKLTQHFIESQLESPLSGQRFYRDEDLAGFAVRVTPTTKSYIVEKRVDGLNRQITIGKCSEMPIDAARKQACIIFADMAKGKDPRTGKRINPNSMITLREVLQKFLAVKPIRKTTQNNYQCSINRHFADWLDKPITSITKDMVELRHHELTVEPNRLGTSGHSRANNALRKLSTLIDFASDRYAIEDEPLVRFNPVSRISRNKLWHRIHPRQGIVPDNKLKDWYRAVTTVKHDVARDFLIFLLLTGMRVGESQRLKWCHIDFEQKLVTVPRELTKSDREHRLPLSDFLVQLLQQRYRHRVESEWVFQSSRISTQHLSERNYVIRAIRAKCGLHFTYHDLRRTFLTMAEKLDVPHYVMKRLANHSVSNDMTGRYIIHDIELLRLHMSRITEAFIELLGADTKDLNEWRRIEAAEHSTTRQLLIPVSSCGQK